MIVVRVELWPGGDPSRAEDLGTAHIANESSLADISNYSVRLLKGSRYSRKPGDVWRTGEVRGYPRTSTLVGPWELLYMALKSALGNRVERVERLCAEGERRASRVRPQRSTHSPIYAIGLTVDETTWGMTHGPTPDLPELLQIDPDPADGLIAYILCFDGEPETGKTPHANPSHVWDGEEWIPL